MRYPTKDLHTSGTLQNIREAAGTAGLCSEFLLPCLDILSCMGVTRLLLHELLLLWVPQHLLLLKLRLLRQQSCFSLLVGLAGRCGCLLVCSCLCCSLFGLPRKPLSDLLCRLRCVRGDLCLCRLSLLGLLLRRLLSILLTLGLLGFLLLLGSFSLRSLSRLLRRLFGLGRLLDALACAILMRRR